MGNPEIQLPRPNRERPGRRHPRVATIDTRGLWTKPPKTRDPLPFDTRGSWTLPISAVIPNEREISSITQTIPTQGGEKV